MNITNLTIVDEDGFDCGSLRDFANKNNLKIIRNNKTKREELNLSIDDLGKDGVGKMIYSYLRKTGEIDKFGFIKLSGTYVSNDIFKIGSEEGVANELCKMISLCSFRNRIKKTDTTECNIWSDLYEVIGIKNKNTGAKFKRVLIKYDIVRQSIFKNSKLGERKQIIVNPNYFRHGTYVGQASIVAFRDVTLNKIHKYSLFNLYLNGFIDIDDVKNNISDINNIPKI